MLFKSGEQVDRSPETLAAFGFEEGDFSATDDVVNVECLPDNYTGAMVFLGMQTQWNRVVNGMTGEERYTGFNYSSLNNVYQGLRVLESDIPDAFQVFQILESETLKLIKEASK